jgi:hypothetical protein
MQYLQRFNIRKWHVITTADNETERLSIQDALLLAALIIHVFLYRGNVYISVKVDCYEPISKKKL